MMLRPKVYIGFLAAVGALLLSPAAVAPAVRATIAWNVGGLVYLAMATYAMATCTANKIRSRAIYHDESAFVILVIILLAIASSFAAIAGLLTEAKAAAQYAKLAYLMLAATTIFVSWSVTQVAFAIHYAHEYYAPHNHQRDTRGGLAFPKDDTPDYWDFLYFATSIGATSQTSDVSICTKSLRRLAALHAVVSFFFNTTVLALTINLAASLI
jgi:uncharacterized membrane protein